jgi:hypothetical protein
LLPDSLRIILTLPTAPCSAPVALAVGIRVVPVLALLPTSVRWPLSPCAVKSPVVLIYDHRLLSSGLGLVVAPLPSFSIGITVIPVPLPTISPVTVVIAPIFVRVIAVVMMIVAMIVTGLWVRPGLRAAIIIIVLVVIIIAITTIRLSIPPVSRCGLSGIITLLALVIAIALITWVRIITAGRIVVWRITA